VRKIMEFGAFVELFPGTDGLLHISQISKTRVRAVSDIFKEGDEVMVRVLEIDRDGKIRLTHKEFEKEGENPYTEAEAAGQAGRDADAGRPEKRGDRGERGDRDRDRGSRRRGRR
jgi:polyribonucleotide nucleotidyltransferase